MAVKMIGLDLDGTLLKKDQTIGAETFKQLMKAKESGIKLVVVSGRPLSGVDFVLKKLKLSGVDEYAITFNGGIVQNLSGKVMAENVLDYMDYQKMQMIADRFNSRFHYETLNRFYTGDHQLNMSIIHESDLVHMPITIFERGEVDSNLKFLKGMYTGTKASIENLYPEVADQLKENYAVSQSGPDMIEVNAQRATKGIALQQLCQKLGFSSKEVMIFGDQKNDCSMFEVSDFYKVAMGNAIDEIKEHADFVTRSNEHNGIAYALKELVL